MTIDQHAVHELTALIDTQLRQFASKEIRSARRAVTWSKRRRLAYASFGALENSLIRTLARLTFWFDDTWPMDENTARECLYFLDLFRAAQVEIGEDAKLFAELVQKFDHSAPLFRHIRTIYGNNVAIIPEGKSAGKSPDAVLRLTGDETLAIECKCPLSLRYRRFLTSNNLLYAIREVVCDKGLRHQVRDYHRAHVVLPVHCKYWEDIDIGSVAGDIFGGNSNAERIESVIVIFPNRFDYTLSDEPRALNGNLVHDYLFVQLTSPKASRPFQLRNAQTSVTRSDGIDVIGAYNGRPIYESRSYFELYYDGRTIPATRFPSVNWQGKEVEPFGYSRNENGYFITPRFLDPSPPKGLAWIHIPPVPVGGGN